jgi:predicted acylesterase/phospholipase RssA
MYEIGALRALEEAIEGIDLTDAHIYVGVSAGSVIAAALANRIPVAHLLRSVATRVDDDPFLPQVFFVPAYREWISRALQVPRLVGEAVNSFVRRRSLLRALRHFAAAVPVAIFDNEPIRRTIHTAFTRHGRTDDFRKLRHRLIIVGTDLGLPSRPIRRRPGTTSRSPPPSRRVPPCPACIPRSGSKGSSAWMACSSRRCTLRSRSSRAASWSCA